MSYTETTLIRSKQIIISNHLIDLGIDNVRQEIIQGLLSKQKYISSKFFYDEKGSRLFEDITHLPEYYPTRTEKGILKKIAPEIMENVKNIDIVELGSGDCSKISILLNSITKENLNSINYIPIDVSHSAIQKSAETLNELFPELSINGLVADFINQINKIPNTRKRLFCFLGSTIGNFSENIINKFLNNLCSNMNTGDSFLLGIDLEKSDRILHAAYNDRQNITAEFNKNILSVINNLIKSDFNENDFEHQAFFNKEKSRIEMHLVANKDLKVTSPFLQSKIEFQKGDNIHTENSYKFSLDKIYKLEQKSGLEIKQIYSDVNTWFSLILFRK